MAHSLKTTGWLCLSVLLTACNALPSTKSPSQRLSYVLTTQQQAEAAYRSNDMEHAAGLYLQLTRMIPQEAEYWYMLGNTYVRTQRPEDAVQAYQQTIARNPKHARAWHNLGIVRMRQATAAFAASADAAKAEDPLHEISTELANQLARIGGSRGNGGNLQEQTSTAAPSPPDFAATMDSAAIVKSSGSDAAPLRRRPGATPGVNQ